MQVLGLCLEEILISLGQNGETLLQNEVIVRHLLLLAQLQPPVLLPVLALAPISVFLRLVLQALVVVLVLAWTREQALAQEGSFEGLELGLSFWETILMFPIIMMALCFHNESTTFQKKKMRTVGVYVA